MGVYEHEPAAFAAEIRSYGVRVTDKYEPGPVGAPSERPDELVDEIRKLTDLLDHGHINQREYETKTAELLARL
ncbi:MAG: SHOCT domain-containing protein [Candidatus Dormibacteria bacterium]